MQFAATRLPKFGILSGGGVTFYMSVDAAKLYGQMHSGRPVAFNIALGCRPSCAITMDWVKVWRQQPGSLFSRLRQRVLLPAQFTST